MNRIDILRILIVLLFSLNTASVSSLDVPLNATKNQFSTDGWICVRGYHKVGNECKLVNIPSNASLNYSGHDWVCNTGFQKSGNECRELIIPPNATLDFTGNNWVCNPGFTKKDLTCREMTVDEKSNQEARLKKILIETQKHSKLSSDPKCEKEFKSGAEVCLSIQNTNFKCKKSLFGEYFESCKVEIEYQLETDYKGSSSIEVKLDCDADISYNDKSIIVQSISKNDQKTTNLYSNDFRRETLQLNLNFPILSEVQSAEIRLINCKINDLRLY